jgi:pyridoxamine 5'-phosphate oxidase
MDEAIKQFEMWLKEAQIHEAIHEPTAMCLSTADAKGRPSGRFVLLKHTDQRGFVFYTNFNSRKSEELKANPFAALSFFWEPLKRQVRIEGDVEPVADDEADLYFANRSHGSQVGAWASWQSQVLTSREELEVRVKALEQQHAGHNVPRPEHWSGWRVKPQRIEFWEEGAFRLHRRDVFEQLADGSIKKYMLYP